MKIRLCYSFADPKAGSYEANRWIDVVIEYQQGKSLLNINGSEKIYEHENIDIDSSNVIHFKNFKADSLLIKNFRVW